MNSCAGKKQIEEFRSYDNQLRSALTSAGRMTEEIKENATKEAELITAQADIDAKKIMVDACNELARVSEDARLKLQKTDFSRRLSDCREPSPGLRRNSTGRLRLA